MSGHKSKVVKLWTMNADTQSCRYRSEAARHFVLNHFEPLHRQKCGPTRSATICPPIVPSPLARPALYGDLGRKGRLQSTGKPR